MKFREILTSTRLHHQKGELAIRIDNQDSSFRWYHFAIDHKELSFDFIYADCSHARLIMNTCLSTAQEHCRNSLEIGLVQYNGINIDDWSQIK